MKAWMRRTLHFIHHFHVIRVDWTQFVRNMKWWVGCEWRSFPVKAHQPHPVEFNYLLSHFHFTTMIQPRGPNTSLDNSTLFTRHEMNWESTHIRHTRCVSLNRKIVDLRWLFVCSFIFQFHFSSIHFASVRVTSQAIGGNCFGSEIMIY